MPLSSSPGGKLAWQAAGGATYRSCLSAAGGKLAWQAAGGATYRSCLSAAGRGKLAWQAAGAATYRTCLSAARRGKLAWQAAAAAAIGLRASKLLLICWPAPQPVASVGDSQARRGRQTLPHNLGAIFLAIAYM